MREWVACFLLSDGNGLCLYRLVCRLRRSPEIVQIGGQLTAEDRAEVIKFLTVARFKKPRNGDLRANFEGAIASSQLLRRSPSFWDCS